MSNVQKAPLLPGFVKAHGEIGNAGPSSGHPRPLQRAHSWPEEGIAERSIALKLHGPLSSATSTQPLLLQSRPHAVPAFPTRDPCDDADERAYGPSVALRWNVKLAASSSGSRQST
ncbi:unnamed protein product [Zymoseptoria tritici ST99CH_1A5]|uniref:Uncharacterized protein n=1 Tax=Zymoseptoria tritici ST99CH_1A5 TaxID=1276529 RepID=A0A1Y6LIA3_ZYMTR|nr:unnamed protein product [Zymoseptoria tritici ST99CH_1A5]